MRRERARTGDGARSVTTELTVTRARLLLDAPLVRPDTVRVPPGSRPGDRGFAARRFTGDAAVTALGPWTDTQRVATFY